MTNRPLSMHVYMCTRVILGARRRSKVRARQPIDTPLPAIIHRLSRKYGTSIGCRAAEVRFRATANWRAGRGRRLYRATEVRATANQTAPFFRKRSAVVPTSVARGGLCRDGPFKSENAQSSTRKSRHFRIYENLARDFARRINARILRFLFQRKDRRGLTGEKKGFARSEVAIQASTFPRYSSLFRILFHVRRLLLLGIYFYGIYARALARKKRQSRKRRSVENRQAHSESDARRGRTVRCPAVG